MPKLDYLKSHNSRNKVNAEQNCPMCSSDVTFLFRIFTLHFSEGEPVLIHEA